MELLGAFGLRPMSVPSSWYLHPRVEMKTPKRCRRPSRRDGSAAFYVAAVAPGHDRSHWETDAQSQNVDVRILDFEAEAPC